jgi:site-specific recombinase XerD
VLPPDAQRVMDDLAEDFQAFLRRVEVTRRPSTIAWYTHVFTVFRLYVEDVHDATATSIDARIRDLEGFTEWNVRRGVSPLAANTYWRGLRTFFKDREQRTGAPNPYHGQMPPGFQPPDPKALAQEDCTRILLAAANYRRWDAFQRTRAAAVIGVMLYAGLRRSEALALLVSDVSFKTREIRVRQGKGRWGGKQRFVPIHAELAGLLGTYLKERARRRVTDEAPEFFSSTRSTGPMGTTTLSFIVRTLVRASGVHFSPHMLRHSFVTHLLRSDVPLYVARDLAGHSHIETTMLYTKVFAKDRHENLQKLSFA